LPLLSGGTVGLADFRGRPLILLFWAPWCPTCNADVRGRQRASGEAKAGGVAMLGVGLLDNRQACAAFVSAHHLSFPNAYDADGRAARAYGVYISAILGSDLADGGVAAVRLHHRGGN
jgi:peroxiredoxin